jgi:hypothetical protein
MGKIILKKTRFPFAGLTTTIITWSFYEGVNSILNLNSWGSFLLMFVAVMLAHFVIVSINEIIKRSYESRN